ncbi:MAG: SH3 domain-containing protein [Chloroflexi bacterium]|nr:SH3 domain-containing protein [Chloroflexota bacterium]
MNRRRSVVLMLVLIALLAFAGTASAQDNDGDGLPNGQDRCPAQAGPRTNGGCPLPTTSVPPQDRDSDGVQDFVDACPDQAGTGFSNGCPTGIQPIDIAPTQAPQLVMVWNSMDVCMVGVPLTATGNVNVREQPTTSANILGQLTPGSQWEPWLRDYDENNQVWFDGAPSPGGYGWVSGEVVITNGQCVYLPQVIHVDASDNGQSIDVKFDPSIIPPEIIDEDGDGWNFGDLFDEFDVVIIDWEDFEVFPQPDITLTPHPQPPQPAPTPGGHVRVFDGSHLIINFLNGDGSVIPTDQKILIGAHRQADGETCLEVGGGLCMDYGLLLPAVNEADPPSESPLCTPDQLARGLDLISAGDGTQGILIGLLLPAVQKVREAASRAQMGDGSVIPGEDVMQDFHFRSLSALLTDPPDPDQPQCGVVIVTPGAEGAVGILIGLDVLLLPAV